MCHDNHCLARDDEHLGLETHTSKGVFLLFETIVPCIFQQAFLFERPKDLKMWDII